MFKGRFSKDGAGLDFEETTRMKLKKFIKDHPNMPFELAPLLVESGKQRKFFEGAIVPLVTFYQHSMDHHDSNDLKNVREWLKIEFNGEFISISGKAHKIAASTKNRLNQGFLERVIEWLTENYAPPEEALNPAKYKDWRDRVRSFENGPMNYIDYLVELKLIKKYK